MKRRSSTKGRPEPIITFFADRNLGTTFVEVLRKHGVIVEAHDDHFPQNTDDRIWIRECANRGWVAITPDISIARNYPEIKECMESGAEVFAPKGKIHPTDFALLIARTQARILRHIKRKRKWESEPFISKIGFDLKNKSKPGKVTSWITKEDWLEKTRRRRGK